MNDQPISREEAERLAKEMLSHYGKQSWDEHFKVDNSANHILVKSVDEFVAMASRRGYRPVSEMDEQGWLCWLNSEYTGRSYVRESFFFYETVATVAERLDKWYGAGQHHVCCIQCKEPLLSTFEEYRVPDGMNDLGMFRCAIPKVVYRSAKAGPDSEVLSVCPGCGLDFIEPMPVEEIKDNE